MNRKNNNKNGEEEQHGNEMKNLEKFIRKKNQQNKVLDKILKDLKEKND